ncbi:Highly reducing polyketide synthase [Alternaria gaisen]|uniref:Highly reducing polyketide synthase n=1 Tax=Alternaria gaisen TaxID=167740 RepID=A0ACB6F6G1_9PLEO|nr:Highly reducing polyketide synthase [Alternaria gaisen]
MSWRFGGVATTPQELLDVLTQELKSSSAVRTATRANINFVFTGQGAQWPGMGRELLVVRAFKDSLNQPRNVLRQLGASWDLFDELVRDKESSRLKEPQLSQPVTTAIQIALVETFRSFGISPGAVVGHSSGETAAVYTAGYLSHDTAIKIAYYRGFSAEIAKAKGMENGAMLATDLGEATAREYVAKLVKGKATVACQNSLNSSTLSGDTTAVSELEEMLSKDSVFNRRLQVDAAYHSHHMEAAAEEYEKSLGDVCVEQPSTKVRFFSSVVGREVWEGFDFTYWTTNLTSTVRYCDALQALCRTQFAQPQGEQSHQIFAEIGPHNALPGPTRQSISGLDKQSTYSYMSALVRGSGGMGTILGVLCELIKHGHHVDLAALRALDPTCQEANVLHDLPSYAWDHSKSFWNESRLSREHRLRKHPYHDLLGLKVTGHTPLRPSWRHLIGVEGLPWLKDHIVDDTIIFPGSGYLCMVMEAAGQLARDTDPPQDIETLVMRNISFTKALIIPESPSRVELQLNFCPRGWTWSQKQLKKISSRELYDELGAVGNTYGPMFRGINKAIIQADRSASFISIPDVTRMMPAQYMRPHFIHPTTLDILLHSSLPLVNRQVGQASIMPVRIDELALSTLIHNESGFSLAAITTLTSADLRGGDADILVFSDGGDATDRPVMSVSGLELRRLAPTGQPVTFGTARDICYEMKWDADVEFISAEFLRPPRLPPAVKQKWDAIDRATDIYIRRCLQHLGKRALDTSGDHHKLLVKWMNSTVAKTQTCEDPTEAKILEMSSSQGIEGEFLARLGPALPEIITGKVNPLQLMLEDGLLYRVYADDSSKCCYDLMAGYLKSKSFKQSGFTVLEIGAGTGGATLPFLQSLDHNGNRPVVFDFTDTSAGFFESAKERLQDWSDVVNFRTLDIKKNPKDQGFTEGFYDIILACNVLHATSSVDSTLSKVRQLLKPEGVLLLLEVTKPRHYHNVTFGTLPGWWKGVNDSRAAGPLLSPEGWSTRMRKASLNMQLAVYDDNETPISSLIVAKPIQEVTKKKQVQIVLDSSVPIWLRKFADQVLSKLRAEEFEVSLTSWDEMTVNPHDSSIRLVIDNDEHPVLSHATPIKLQSVTEMLKAPSHVLWISVVHDPQFSENPSKHLITGISRTAHAENDRLEMITVDVQQSICQEEGKEEGNRFMSFIMGLVISPSKADLLTMEREYVYKNGQVNIPRVLPSPDIQGWMPGNVTGLPEMKPFHDSQKAWILDIERSEFMKMPVFTENDTFRKSLGENEIEIDVEAIGVPELLIRRSINGFAGRVIAIGSKVDGIKVKDNIVAFAASSYPNRLRVHQSQARVVPQGVSSRIAAALLIPLMAVSHALVNMASTNSPIVLIHGAIGTIAQSAVAIAKALGSVIIQTVSGDVESAALDDVVSRFADHVVPDQGYSSKHQLQKVLGQRKVDVILGFSKNRVSKEVAGTLKPSGHCIHIENGPKPSLQIEQLQYLSDTTISRFRMDAVVKAQPEAVAVAFSTVVDAPGSSKMDIKAVNVVSRPVGELDRLFKQEYQHHRNESTLLHVDDCLVRVWSSEKRSLSLDSDATYVVSGGRGDLGKRFIRLMCAAGARHFVTLSRGVSSSHTQLTSLQTELQENVGNDCVLQDIQCNIADLNEVQNALTIIKTQGLPPVRGIIQAAVALEDSTMNFITSDSFNRVLGAKAHGTMNLRNAFAPEGLAFFISLSSAVTVIGTSGQSNSNAGNSVQDALAQFSNRDGCHYMSLNIGTIEGADATADNQTRVQALRRQGLISITPDELLGFFRYSVTSEARKGHRCRQAIIGFTPESLSLTTAANGTVHSPMFTHKTFKATIQETRDFEKISQLMALWIGEKVANLVAADASEVDLGSSIADFYVDSLIIIELRNWINKELQASISIPETMESQNLLSLGAKVASRSALVPSSISSKVPNSNDEALSIDATASLSLAPSSQPPEMLETPCAQLQRLPAPDFHTALDMLIESRKGFCTQAELEETLRASAEWRGVEKADRDAIVSKFTGSNLRLESYEKALHLERREPLQDHAVFYLGHITGQAPNHTQAERAAIIVHSTLSFKHQLDMGVLEQNSLNGSPLCMSTLQWLFHATQEPRHELDVMRKKYRASGNVAIMRRGHIFVATVHDDDGLAALVALFEDVIQHSEDAIPALSILTSHRRDDWAQLKGSLESITGNASKLEAIQSAAFVICLDEGAPTNPGERATSQLLNDRHLSNRWLDKTLQFSVAANGVSSLIGLNSTLDGLSVKQLHEAITEQILA